jgi:AcrR family transcriptional regulator
MELTTKSADALQAIHDYLAQEDLAAGTEGRRRIMQAVLALAVGKGISGVTMRSIAKHVDIKAASLYSHFEGGKDELIGETLRWNYNEFFLMILNALPDEGTATDQLRGLVRGHIDFQLSSAWQNLFETLIAADKAGNFLSEATREQVRHRRRLYLNYVRALMNEIQQDDFDTARAWGVINFLNEAITLASHVPQDTGREELDRFAFSVCMAIAQSRPDGRTP